MDKDEQNAFDSLASALYNALSLIEQAYEANPDRLGEDAVMVMAEARLALEGAQR